MARQYGVQQVELLRELGYEVEKMPLCTDNQGAETAVVAETLTPLMKSVKVDKVINSTLTCI